MKPLNQFIFIIIFGILAAFLSCEKNEIVRTMDTRTNTVEINSSVVVAVGTVLDIGKAKIVEHGHCWSINPEPTVDDFKSELGPINERDTFSTQLSKITPGLEHFIRSYIYDGTNYVYGNTLSFMITADDLGFTTQPVTTIDQTTVQVNTEVNNIGSINFDDYGHCWSQTDPPTIENSVTSYGRLDTNKGYISNINNLTQGRYFIRGYLLSDGGVIYSNMVIFESTIRVITGSITTVSDTEANAEGTIRSLGVNPIVDYGHCWSALTSSPSVNENRSSLGTTDRLGSYSSDVDNLIPDVTYYIRAYATDGTHVFYGDISSFVAGK